jgi:hypothetical protein
MSRQEGQEGQEIMRKDLVGKRPSCTGDCVRRDRLRSQPLPFWTAECFEHVAGQGHVRPNVATRCWISDQSIVNAPIYYVCRRAISLLGVALLSFLSHKVTASVRLSLTLTHPNLRYEPLNSNATRP